MPPNAAWSHGSARPSGSKGKSSASEDLTIDGDVEGSIELGGHSLTIGQEANIKADLLAKTVTISGKVNGNVKGVEKVDLRSTASVTGDITAPEVQHGRRRHRDRQDPRGLGGRQADDKRRAFAFAGTHGGDTSPRASR